MSDSAKLTEGSVAWHLFSQSAPMLFGIAAIMSVGIVDAYFIGQLGSNPLAAVSFIFPITIALSSLGVGVIAAISSVVSRALGEGDDAKARQLGSLGMLLASLFGLITGATLYLVKDPLFNLMNADEELLPLINAYMAPYALGFPLLLANMGGNGVLRGQGAAKRASAILLSFAATNWILDPILITGWMIEGFDGYGIAGAAYATVAGWAVGLLMAIILVRTGEIPFAPACAFHCDWRSGALSLLKVGGPASLSNAINPIGLSVLTAMLATYGKEAVAGFGAAGRLQSFSVVPMLALSSGIGAIVGQNWGAGNGTRARRALLYAILFCAGYGTVVAAVLFLSREWIAGFFTDDQAVITQIGSYIAIAVWGFAGYGALIVSNGALNAIGKSELSLVQSALRVLVIMVPAAWLLGPLLGAQSIYTAELLSNLIGGGLAGAISLYILSRKC